MNGPQDLGGQHGFGPIAPDPGAPVFHAEWERRALALTLAAGAMGAWTLDESRHARESLPPVTYYGARYYQIWIEALERLLIRHGFVTADELRERRVISPGAPPKRVLLAGEVAASIARGSPASRDPAGSDPVFHAGERVRTRVMHPETHTRLPRYARGKRGRILHVCGFHVLPDSNAHGGGEAPDWLYTVEFAGQELWGPESDPALTVSIDAWERYLEPA